MHKKIILFDNCDFESFPIGGTLTFARQLIKSIPSENILLVGITTQNIKVGEWTNIELNGTVYNFFPIMKVRSGNKRPLIPLRLSSFFALLRYLIKIRKKGSAYIFTQTPQFLFALNLYRWKSICFNFAGVGNAVALSRYKGLRFLGDLYEKSLFKILRKEGIRVLAAADSNAINVLVKRSKGLLDKKVIRPFPTRYDDNIFYAKDKLSSRVLLGLPLGKKIFVSVGRLSWVKGWDLLIDVMRLQKTENCLLILVGDGEERFKIEKVGKEMIEKDFLKITGYVSPDQVSLYLNSADLVLVGSHEEGWPTCIVEALACGKAVVSTDVSGAKELIKDGINGFVVSGRNPTLYNNAITKALELKDCSNYSFEISQKYSIKNLFSELQNAWPEINDDGVN